MAPKSASKSPRRGFEADCGGALGSARGAFLGRAVVKAEKSSCCKLDAAGVLRANAAIVVSTVFAEIDSPAGVPTELTESPELADIVADGFP